MDATALKSAQSGLSCCLKAGRLLTVVVFGVVAGLSGCAKDERVVAADAMARAAASRSNPGEDTNTNGTLREIARDSAGVAKAQASGALAQIAIRSATEKYADWSLAQARIVQLSRDIGSSAGVALSTQNQVRVAASANPQPTIDQINLFAAQARGEGNAPFFLESEQGGIASLSATRVKLSELESQIATIRQQLDSLVQERDAALSQAEALIKSSEQAKGDEKLEQFKEAAARRDAAGETARQIAQAQAQLAILQADLAAQQELAKSLDSALASFGGRTQQLEANWKQVEGELAKQSDLAKAVLTAADRPVVAKALELNVLVTSNEALGGEIIKLLEEAAAGFKTAGDAAAAFTREIGQASPGTYPQNVPETLSKAFSPLFYRLEGVEANRFLASIHRQNAEALVARKNAAVVLTSALANAAASLPVEVSTDLFNTEIVTQRLQSSVDAAKVAIDAGLSDIDQISSGTGELQNAAKVVRAYLLYDRALLGRVARAGGVAPELVSLIDQSIADAKSQIGEARNANARFPTPVAEINVPATTAEPGPLQAPPASPQATPTTTSETSPQDTLQDTPQVAPQPMPAPQPAPEAPNPATGEGEQR